MPLSSHDPRERGDARLLDRSSGMGQQPPAPRLLHGIGVEQTLSEQRNPFRACT
jgi:hypothetical protein